MVYRRGAPSTVIVFIVGSGWVRGHAARRYVSCRHVYAACQPERKTSVYTRLNLTCVYIDTTDGGRRRLFHSLGVPQVQLEIVLHEKFSPETGPANFALLREEAEHTSAALCVGDWPHVERHHCLVGLGTIHWQHLQCMY